MRRNILLPLEYKFWRSVETIPFHSCWEWVGTIKKDSGYGQVGHNGKTLLAHRVSLQMHKIDLVAGLVVDHICKNRSCVNPKHLRQVSQKINAIDNGEGPAACNARREFCVRGHKLPEKRNSIGIRVCAACKKQWRVNHPEYMREYKKRKRDRSK